MNLRAKLGIFVLTPQEQRTIAFVVLALVIGLWTKHYRANRPAAPNELSQQVASTPGSPSPAPSPKPR